MRSRVVSLPVFWDNIDRSHRRAAAKSRDHRVLSHRAITAMSLRAVIGRTTAASRRGCPHWCTRPLAPASTAAAPRGARASAHSGRAPANAAAHGLVAAASVPVPPAFAAGARIGSPAAYDTMHAAALVRAVRLMPAWAAVGGDGFCSLRPYVSRGALSVPSAVR